MSKTILVESCYQCPYRRILPKADASKCLLTNAYIPKGLSHVESFPIPASCPLDGDEDG